MDAIGAIENLLRGTTIEGWIEDCDIIHHLRLTYVEYVAVARPLCLIADMIALILVHSADIVVQIQRTLTGGRIKCIAAAALNVYRTQAVAALLTEVILLAVVRIRKHSNRRADKVLLMTDTVARSCVGETDINYSVSMAGGWILLSSLH